MRSEAEHRLGVEPAGYTWQSRLNPAPHPGGARLRGGEPRRGFAHRTRWHSWPGAAGITLCALTAALVLSLVVPATAAAQAPERPRLLKAPNREEVWVVSGGQRRWVPDVATFSARGYRWDDVELVAPAVLREIPVGRADLDRPLLRDAASGALYVQTAAGSRQVPDLATFAALGLTWENVLPLIGGTPAAGGPAGNAHTAGFGPPLPHAVSGLPLAHADPARVPLSTRPTGDVPAPLQEALRAVEQYAPTADWPALLRRFGVALRLGEVPRGALAAYRAEDRTLTIGEAYAGAHPHALATVLVHEAVHALLDAQGAAGRRGRACVDEEVHAFAMQAAFWAAHRPQGAGPAAASALEAELDRVLAAARDDALVATVISNWAYTLRCYFPDSSVGE